MSTNRIFVTTLSPSAATKEEKKESLSEVFLPRVIEKLKDETDYKQHAELSDHLKSKQDDFVGQCFDAVEQLKTPDEKILFYISRLSEIEESLRFATKKIAVDENLLAIQGLLKSLQETFENAMKEVSQNTSVHYAGPILNSVTATSPESSAYLRFMDFINKKEYGKAYDDMSQNLSDYLKISNDEFRSIESKLEPLSRTETGDDKKSLDKVIEQISDIFQLIHSDAPGEDDDLIKALKLSEQILKP